MRKNSRRIFERSAPLRYLMLLLLVGCAVVTIACTRQAGGMPVANSVSSFARAVQDPNQAENYRKLAAAKRKAAQRVPERRACYEAWARYYDCLADKAETGDNKDCGAQPGC